jgi:hypothetical protein
VGQNELCPKTLRWVAERMRQSVQAMKDRKFDQANDGKNFRTAFAIAKAAGIATLTVEEVSLERLATHIEQGIKNETSKKDG